MCGEKNHFSIFLYPTQGSPPRVRGKVLVSLENLRKDRITPACAGKSPCSPCIPCGPGDHPRVCGEKAIRHIINGMSEGSPPRVRGKAEERKKAPLSSRITPACAGKSPILILSGKAGKDHPRVCGEKVRISCPLYKFKGSPPRVRGKVIHSSQRLVHRRITPACAGKSQLALSDCQQHEDHPRVCGEKFQQMFQLLLLLGSPPRVRGKD